MNLDKMGLAVFETSLRTNFYPLSLTRPTFDLFYGTGSLLSRIEEKTTCKTDYLFVPEYLANTTMESHPDAIVNDEVEGNCLAVNSLIADRPEVWHSIDRAIEEKGEIVYVDSAGMPVFGIVDCLTPEQVGRGLKGAGVRFKQIDPEIEEFALLEFPWKLVEQNGLAISSDFSTKYSDKQRAEGDFETRGSKFSISSMTDIERFVTLDSRDGPIIIEDGAHVQSFSHIAGPCFIGKGAIVKSAKIREGTSVGEFCKISGEVEQAIISSYTNKNHDGFLGHSVIGSWVNLGALTTTSDLKNTYGEIKMNVCGKTVKTGTNKLGAFVGDMAKTAIGTTINSGKSIGVSSFALDNVTDDIPSFTIHSESSRTKNVELYIDSAVETQRRMMDRRGIRMSEAYLSMIKAVFKMTSRDRVAGHVAKEKFKN